MSYFPPYQHRGSYDRGAYDRASHSSYENPYERSYERIPMTPDYSMIPAHLMSPLALPLPQFQPHSYSNPNLAMHNPYLTMVNNNDAALDQLNISRTVIIKNINDDVTLSQLLDEISYGPIEYIKMFSKPALRNFADTPIKNFKCCYISFVNSKVSINFFLHFQQLNHLSDLKKKLDSEHLKISLNDNKGLGNSSKDFLKLKTLNYILEFNATRAIKIKFRINDEIIIDDFVAKIKEELSSLGEIEKIAHEITNDDQSDDDDFPDVLQDFKTFIVKVHFTSIDGSIKNYEKNLKLIQTDKQSLLDKVHHNYFILDTHFIKDRCDKTSIKDYNHHSGHSVHPGHSQPSHPLQYHQHSAAQSFIDDELAYSDADGTEEDYFDFPPARPPHPMYSQPQYVPMSPTLNMNPSMNYNPDPYNIGNRTIYLGNLHPSSTVEEIANNIRAGGLVETIKYYPEKRNCFITFIDPNVALKFYLNHQVLHQLIIHGYDITVGWAKTHSGPLSRDIALAVTAGASRNVYIGIKLQKDKPDDPEKPSLPTEEQLRRDFSHFGELEQINFYHNNDCGFLNFMNIADAIKLVELFEAHDAESITDITKDPELYTRYEKFKISFGKDRCGNPPKFSFKKNFGKSRQKIYFDKKKEEEKKESISDEAALVFGIIKNDDKGPEESNATEEENVDLESVTTTPEKASPAAENKDTESVKIGVSEEDYEKNEDEEDDDDDDDDISILIGSDDTSSTTANNSHSNSKGSSKLEKKKLYNNLANTSDSFIPLRTRKSTSFSSLSLNGKKYHSTSVPHTPKFHHPQYYRAPSNYGYYNGPMTPTFSAPVGGFFQPMHMMGAVPPPPPPMGMYENRNTFSGSQVMAQYLAKSQSDSMFYQPNVVYDLEDRRKKK